MNSNITTGESWFVPVEILKSTCLILAIALSTFFLVIILFDKACHTVPMLLLGNTCLGTIGLACSLLAVSLAAIRHDLHRNYSQDAMCIGRCYAGYVTGCWLNYSFAIEGIYRYVIVVYPTRLSWQSARCQAMLIVIVWIFGITFPFAFLLTDGIVYNAENQICQVPFGFSFTVIYAALCVYLVPLTSIMLIYATLVVHVKQIHKRVTVANILLRAQHELQMVRRTLMLIMVVITLGMPYTVFIVLSFFDRAPRHHYRIAYGFFDVSLALLMLALVQLNESLRTAVKRRFSMRSNAIETITA